MLMTEMQATIRTLTIQMGNLSKWLGNIQSDQKKMAERVDALYKEMRAEPKKLDHGKSHG